MEGLPFRTAHELVAVAAERSADPDYETLDAAAQAVLGESLSALVDRPAVEDALDPAASVASRDSAGGPAPEAVADQLDAARADLDADRETLDDERAGLADAEAGLREEVAGYV
jgi:argininosuccinate lyase